MCDDLCREARGAEAVLLLSFRSRSIGMPGAAAELPAGMTVKCRAYTTSLHEKSRVSYTEGD